MLKLKLQYFGHLMRTDSLEERPWCWERLKAGGERDDRGWGGWMASVTQWIWVWVDSGSWWWTGRPGVLWSMGSQRVGHNWATELNWTEGVSKTLKSPAVWPDSWTHPTLIPHKEPGYCFPSTPREWASKGRYCLFSLPTAATGAPIKPCLNFLSGLQSISID